MELVKGLAEPLPVWWKKTLPIAEIKSILVRGTNWIGDAVMTLPALKALRDTFPGGRITVLAKPWAIEVYRLSRLADDLMIYEDPGTHHGAGGVFKLSARLRKEGFDAAILFQNAIEASIIAFLARIPIRGGYDTDGRLFLLTHAVRRQNKVRQLHQTRYYWEMVRALGAKGEFNLPRLFPPESVTMQMPKGSLIGLAPGAQYGPAKRWFPHRFAELADHLRESLSAQILIFGSKGDQPVAEEIKRLTRHDVINLTGKTTLSEAIGIMSHLRIFVTNDSGLMHVAAALGVPVVAIFGSTDPNATGPVGPKTRILYHPVPCGPCLKTYCPSDFRCMDLIKVEEVFDAVKAFWEEGE